MHRVPFRLPEPRSSEHLPRETYLNRERSWLEFNARVLAEAKNGRNPPLERLKFCAIASSNLDEFFMVRVAGVHHQLAAGVVSPSPDGLTPVQNLDLIRTTTQSMMEDIQGALGDVLSLLRTKGISLVRYGDLDDARRDHLRAYYLDQIQPVLTPLAVDPSHPFPYISNLSLNLAVVLEEKKDEVFARIKIPIEVLNRVIQLPSGEWMLLEDVISAHLDELFKGRRVVAHYLFRVTRNTDYEFEQEEAEDLLATIEAGLRRRRFGSVVRLEVEGDFPGDLLGDLCVRLGVDERDVYSLDGVLGGADLMGLVAIDPQWVYPKFSPKSLTLGREDRSLFEHLQQKDVLLHHPYQSFEPVVEFIETAAQDASVLAIKQTLYRTGGDARILRALQTAAEMGKQVVVLVELKARFDEQRNISWARALERSGVHVVYGLARLKTHAKITLVVRRESMGLRRYIHVGTGNYNPRTAALYTDLSFFTSNPQVGIDASALFNHLTGYSDATYPHLVVAPEEMRERFCFLIEREMAHAQMGRVAQIWAKMNSLTDPQMINMLYHASQAGVKIHLIVRGVCCLRPQVEGLSENIVVRSLLGRFLEHARVFYFENDGDPEVLVGSADWMTRNLNRRVEVAIPITRSGQQRYLKDLLQVEFSDTRGAWELQSDGTYVKVKGRWLSAQRHFMLKHGHLLED